MTKQPTTHWDRSLDRGRLSISHATLLGELQLGQGLQRCCTPIYGAIIPQIEILVKLKRAVFSPCHFKRHRTNELDTERTGSCAPSSTRILRFSTSGRPEALGACYVAAWPLPRLGSHQLAAGSFRTHHALVGQRSTITALTASCSPYGCLPVQGCQQMVRSTYYRRTLLRSLYSDPQHCNGNDRQCVGNLCIVL